MSLNRRRNIFTLGDFQEKLNRRPEVDLFEKDPFKVQSYNFHYAERPTFPVASTSAPSTSNNAQHTNGGCGCQTFFYNYGFDDDNAVDRRKSTVLGNDERILNLTDFQEYRRKKFLQDIGPSPSRLRQHSKSLLAKPFDSKILNAASRSSQSYTKFSPSLEMRPTFMQMSKPSCSLRNSENMNSHRDIQIKRTATPQPQSHSRLFKTFSSPLSDINIKRKSLGSACEININIKNVEDKSLQDNVNIKIETDSLYKNLNLNSGSSKNHFKHKNNSNLASFGSSETFIIDRKPTKYSSKGQESQGMVRNRGGERMKELTAIYSSQVLKKSSTKRNFKSNERIPSRIPLGLSNDNNSNSSRLYDNNSHLMKNNLFRSKSLLEKPKINKSSITNCYLQKSPYNNLSSSTSKRLHSRDSQPFGTKKSELKMTVPLRLSNSSKLPINVNINVYADKLKLLKV